MSSIKCKSCGLINFSNAVECKRCQRQFVTNQSKSSQFQNFQTPPPPPNFGNEKNPPIHSDLQQRMPCIKCGELNNVAIQNFKKKYVPLVIAFTIFLGLIPYFILRALLSTTHYLSAPFCGNCWNRYNKSTTYSALNLIVFIVIIVAGTVFAFQIDSEAFLLIVVLGAFASFAIGRFFLSSIGPKYKKIDSKQVIIDAPLVGEILYTR